MDIIAYLLFFIAGLGFGYAADGLWKFVPLLFPILLALTPLFRDGVDGATILRLLLALAVTFAGVLLGAALDARSAERRPAGAA
jgi:hypothetical protein